ncbi:MAG: nucleoid-associated protein [Bacteroidota bacterium]
MPESIAIDSIRLRQLYVGAISDEGIFKNNELIKLEQGLTEVLTSFFLKSFKMENFMTFTHELDVEYNGAFVSAGSVFEDPQRFLEEAQNLLKLLYAFSENGNIKEGELYITHFEDVPLEDDTVSAIGIFKSEDRDPFIKVYQQEKELGLMADEGISFNNIHKGALILDTPDLKTYKVLVFDKSSKGGQAKFWVDHFLNLKPLEDEYFQTRNFMHLCKDFALHGQQDADRAEQVDLINRSMDFFKERDHFNQRDFEEEVLPDEEQREAFLRYRDEFMEQRQLEDLQEDFEISAPAMQAARRQMRSVIKLDKNFHVYVHGKRSLIEKGYDADRGKHFYKLYFDEEN